MSGHQYNKVGVIGAGTMGIGVTADLVLHGVETVLVDIDNRVLEKAKLEIKKIIRMAPLMKNKTNDFSVDEMMGKIRFTTNIEHIHDVDFVVENVNEVWETKKQVYIQADRICKLDVCFGANTSCFSITQLASVTSRPDKLIGMHFMNPVFLKPVIEVIRGFHTSDSTVEEAKAFLSRMEKTSIIVKDFPGFVLNRVSHLFMNEAAFVVQDQVATPQQVDELFKKCYGHTMGPLETADLIGLDTVVHSLQVLYETYQDPKFRCCPLLKKMVNAGLLGRKSGEGFYQYN